MGTKGGLKDGFPQMKPAFIITVDWDATHLLGPTTQPKNLLTYGKLRGTVKPVHDSSHPPFAADFVDGGAWIQLEALASGETWAKGNISVLLKVVEPPNTSADPETESGFIRLQWYGVGPFPKTLNSILEKDDSELIKVTETETEPGSTGGGYSKITMYTDRSVTLSFQTGDQRYKYLEHAVYVGHCRMVVVPAEEGNKVVYEMKVSYLTA